MHTLKKAVARKVQTSNQKLAIVATEFHIERRESYYKVRFRDLDGQKQTIAIGRELFTTPYKVVAELLKAQGVEIDRLAVRNLFVLTVKIAGTSFLFTNHSVQLRYPGLYIPDRPAGPGSSVCWMYLLVKRTGLK